MIKFKRLKSAIISSAVAISALAAPLTTAVTPSLTANAAGGDNYAKLLQYSLYFYDANMCGKMDGDCALSWRSDCHTGDDVVGGFHDAGDHVWFGQPEGYTAATLGWAYYEFKDAFDATGQTAHLKVITDRFAKFMRDATVLNGGSVSKVLIEKGEGGQDHSYWGAPELQGNRGRMLWTTDGAANITAEYAAALAANYINFGNPDDLTYAKALFNFAKQHQGSYSCEFYGNKETSDEIAWAACWLYLATKDNSYMGDIQNIGTAYWVHCWENVSLGAAILKGEITGDWSCTNALGDMSGDGYKFYDQWGSARHNATAQMCQLIAAKHGHGNAAWAKGQMEYLTGDRSFANGQSYCLVVGFKDNSSKNPHHRAASPDADASEQNDGIANKNLLIGALCGGPVDANGTYKDIRSDYKGNEVACDYNAGLVGAAAGLYSNYKSGSIETNITGVSKIYSGSSNNQTTPTTTTTTTTTQGGNNNNTTTTTTNGGNSSSSGDVVLEGSKLGATTEEGDDGAINNVAEFPHNGAKSLTMYLKVNSNDTEVSGGFGTWNGEWLQEEFSGVKVGSDKTVAIDYTIPSNAGTNIKAMVWWPHDDGVTIQKIVLHNGTSSGNNNTTTSRTTTSTTSRTTTTTTNGGNGSSSGDVVLEGSKLGATTEEGDDGAINNVAEFPHNGAKSLTMYLKVNSNDTEVSGGFGTWNGEWLQEEFSGVKVGSDKTVAIDYTIPSNAGTNIKAMVWWPHDDGVTIEKIVLHNGTSSGNNNTTTSRTTSTTSRTTTTTTNGGNGSSSGDVVLEGSKLGATTEEGDDGAINNVAEFPHNGAKSLTMYLKVNSNDTEVSGGFGTWNGEWLQEEFSGVKVGSDKTVAIDYTIPSNAGTNIKAMVWWPHDDDVTIQKIVLHNGSGSSNNNTTSKTTTTTTTSRTTTSTTTSTTTTTATEAPKQDKPTLLGDSNCDGIVDLSDAVLIMQALANPNKYGKQGTAELHISEQGWINADVHQKGNGVSTNDALAIQLKLLGRISGFPIDVLN